MKLPMRLLCLPTFLLALQSAALAQTNITMWGVDLQHTGANTNETILTPGTISSPGNFGLLYTQQTDGQTYGQPLIASGVNVGGTNHNLVFVATEHDSIYAFDADTNTGGNASPIWKDSFIQAGVTQPVPQSVVGSGDISIELGITTTPVIDTTSSTIYIVSKVQKISDSSYHQYLHALDLATGAEKFGGPVEINPTFAGSSNDGVGGVIPFSALHEHSRAAMILYNGIVYISYASHSDTTPYHGEIIGYNATTLALAKTFIATPNGNNPEGGIWGAGAGPAIDSNGNMYVAIANGNFDQTSSPYTTGTNWGESMLKLPTTGTFNVSYSNTLNWFTPNVWQTLNNGDLDLGSSGLLLLPDQAAGPHQHILVGGGKGSVLYVVDRDNMGGVTVSPTPDNAIQEIAIPGAHWLFVTPSYWNGNIYYASGGGPIEQRTVGYNAADGTYIGTTPITSTDVINNKGAGVFISANGNTPGTGIVWALWGAGIRAYNAASVAGSPIYSANSTVPPNTGCQTTKFSLPTVANGKVYYTAFDANNIGHLFVYGLLPTAVGTPSNPSNAAATANASSQITVTWTDNSTNESGFKVKRATSAAGPFTQVGSTVSANVTTFTDNGLSPLTTYYYQVVATNANGDSNATNVASATTFPIYAPAGLVAYWNLDDNSVSSVLDFTGNGHTGAVNGEVTSVNGYINGAFNFHGTGNATSNISVASKPDIQFSANQSFSISAWVFPSALRSSDEAVITKSADQGNEYGIWINSANKWVFRGNGGDIVGPVATESVWTHVAVVQDGVAGTRSLYINGTLAATGVAQAADGAGALWMGQQNVAGTPDSFPGIIDEVRIYNTALGITDIKNLLSPPILEGVSTQTQGVSGSFGVIIAPSTTKVIEPRQGTTAGTYNIALSFAAPVNSMTATLGLQGGGAAVGSVNSITYDSTGKVATVKLTGVGNIQGLNLHLSGIQPGNGSADIPFNVLWGDINGDNVVNTLDYNIVHNSHAATVNSTTAFYDINCDGKIDASDDALVGIGNNLGTESDTNLALYATATATSPATGSIAALAFDNNFTTTRWESAQADPQTLTVDLGTICTVHSMAIDWEDASAKTYTIDISPDGSSWSNLETVPNNPPGGGFNRFSGLSGVGRYVRLNGTVRNTMYGYSIWEFQIFGVVGTPSGGGGPVPVISSILSTTGKQGAPFSYQTKASNSPTSFAATGLPAGLNINPTTGLIYGTPYVSGTSSVTLTATNSGGTSTAATLSLNIAANGDTNLALNKTATASSGNAALAFNGNLGDRWESASADPQYIIVDLGQVDTIHAISIEWETASGQNYTLDISNDQVTWTNLVTVTNNPSYANPAPLLTYGGLGATGRYVRMYGTTRSTGYGYSIWEMQVLGVASTGSTPTFASQPASQVTALGTPVTFTANPSGAGPFTYQWQLNGTNIPGATGSTYTIPSAGAGDQGTYVVVITNGYGSTTSNTFTLGTGSSVPGTNGTQDTPTMPQWAFILLTLSMLFAARRYLKPAQQA